MDVMACWKGTSKVPPGLVLDTNTVLDWLVFDDPGMALVAAAIQNGSMSWLACPRMREELARTLSYVDLAKWRPDVEKVLTTFDRHAHMFAAPPLSPAALRCSDPDDQVFMDLALETKADWLLTHDRALLKLARQAWGQGVRVLTPKAFNAAAAG
jgi:uncharacterized protein